MALTRFLLYSPSQSYRRSCSTALKADLQLSPTLSLRLSLELIQAPKAHRHTNPPSRPRLFHRPVVQAPPTTSVNKYAPPPKTRANSPIRCILPSTLDNNTSLPADRHPSTRFLAHAPSCIRKLKTTSRSCETPSQKAYTVAGDAHTSTPLCFQTQLRPPSPEHEWPPHRRP